MKKVEQVNRSGKVVLGKDLPLNKKQLGELLASHFPLEKEDGKFVFLHGGTKYYLLVKNITYLGHPHPIFKKRIQVPPEWKKLLQKENSFLLGVYHHGDNIVFALFEKRLRGKSSSAHISTIDILKATESGVFQKVDKKGNHLLVFREDKVRAVFDSLMKKEKIGDTPEVSVFNEFSSSLSREWDGIDAYREMIDAKFSQKFQPEWPGFYLEFQFEKFLDVNEEHQKICKYVRNKKTGDLDFDVDFIKAKFLGDLKTHSVTSAGIPGNDKKSVDTAIGRYGKLWYLVFEIIYRKDSLFDCEVSRFWNTQISESQGIQKDLENYCKKMKHDAILKNFYILEINKFNKKYLSDYKQGKNSNGKQRAVKIQIERKNIDNFVIYRKSLSERSV